MFAPIEEGSEPWRRPVVLFANIFARGTNFVPWHSRPCSGTGKACPEHREGMPVARVWLRLCRPVSFSHQPSILSESVGKVRGGENR